MTKEHTTFYLVGGSLANMYLQDICQNNEETVIFNHLPDYWLIMGFGPRIYIRRLQWVLHGPQKLCNQGKHYFLVSKLLLKTALCKQNLKSAARWWVWPAWEIIAEFPRSWHKLHIIQEKESYPYESYPVSLLCKIYCWRINLNYAIFHQTFWGCRTKKWNCQKHWHKPKVKFRWNDNSNAVHLCRVNCFCR